MRSGYLKVPIREAVGNYIPALASKDDETRIEALAAMAKFSDDEGVEILQHAMARGMTTLEMSDLFGWSSSKTRDMLKKFWKIQQGESAFRCNKKQVAAEAILMRDLLVSHATRDGAFATAWGIWDASAKLLQSLGLVERAPAKVDVSTRNEKWVISVDKTTNAVKPIAMHEISEADQQAYPPAQEDVIDADFEVKDEVGEQ